MARMPSSPSSLPSHQGRHDRSYDRSHDRGPRHDSLGSFAWSPSSPPPQPQTQTKNTRTYSHKPFFRSRPPPARPWARPVSGSGDSPAAAVRGRQPTMRSPLGCKLGQAELDPFRGLTPEKDGNGDRLVDVEAGLEIGGDQDDAPFDAFDQELLAQLQPVDHDGQNHEEEDTVSPLPDLDASSAILFDSKLSTPETKVDSPFFNKASSRAYEMPLRGPLLSSSPYGGPASSPLLGIKNMSRLSAPNVDKIGSPEAWSSESFVSPAPPLPRLNKRKSPELFVSPGPSHTEKRLQSSSSASPAEYQQHRLQLNHAPQSIPQTIQGIELVSTHALPDRFRSLFRFPVFNAMQSKCFETIYHGDSNFVLAAPTGCGKTVIMELAICRLLMTSRDVNFKVIYQAPTKSLCSERLRDWKAKFAVLDLQCAELTGDTDLSQMQNVHNASIIITTPEKWDSMTRKWKDHHRLMQLIALFLIDEVHMLKESRGATLEAVVSRMKSMDSNTRFIALSATIPNSDDIAKWLGRNPIMKHLPACREAFGENFRPVKLQKFVYGYQSNGNDFVFNKVCESKLPEIIERHSKKKPILIFCSTRNSAIGTSKYLAKLWEETNPPRRLWKNSSGHVIIKDGDLKSIISTGVAYHHAGLSPDDRRAVEKGFLERHISIICSTSTLAVGVNLPCHLVIIKNTVAWQGNSFKPYSDLEMIQMLGRAGRPQFDDSAVAVIQTRREKVEYYERLASGSEPLESCLHLNLIDHLNAEISLGTITNISSAVKWLSGTFFFTRLRKNPNHYNLKEGAKHADEQEMLRETCEKDIKLLQQHSLVKSGDHLKSTEPGHTMARYYVKFDTMRLFLSLPRKAKVPEILSMLSQADEFREIRIKPGEKSLYKEINKGSNIKYSLKVDIGLPCHKIFLLIQAELGGVELPIHEQFQKHKLAFQQDKLFVFTHVNRLIRCIIDIQISLQDAECARNALYLSRSIGARVWDGSPLELKQIEQIGAVAVRKLVSAGIKSIEALEATEADRIDMLLSKNPPFGVKLLKKAADFPKPRVSMKLVKKNIKQGQFPKVFVRASIGFIPENSPSVFRRKYVFLCFLAETSDGRLVDFRRISATKLQNGHDFQIIAELTSPEQYISGYVMCDGIAGTQRQAILTPNIPSSCFPEKSDVDRQSETNNSGKTREDFPRHASSKRLESEDFGDGGLFDEDLIAAGDHESLPDGSQDELDVITPHVPRKSAVAQLDINPPIHPDSSSEQTEGPMRLPNGNFACSHRCKDKTACRHMCCRDGLGKPPRAIKRQISCIPQPSLDHGGIRKIEEFIPKNEEQPLKPVRKIEVIDLSGTDEDVAETRLPLKQSAASNPTKTPENKKTNPTSLMWSSCSDYLDDLNILDASLAAKRPPETEDLNDYESAWVDEFTSPIGTLTPEPNKDVPVDQSKAAFTSDIDDFMQFVEFDESPGMKKDLRISPLPRISESKDINQLQKDVSHGAPSRCAKRPFPSVMEDSPLGYKQPKLTAIAEQPTISPLQLANINRLPHDEEKKDEADGIDQGLLEEFRDVVEFI